MQPQKNKTSSVKTARKSSKIKDCPYCKSDLTETERDFFPCSCTFQACVDCYKDIMKNKGVCPICHAHLKFEVNSLNASKRDELSKAEQDKVPAKKTEKKSTTTTTVVTTVSIKGSTRTEQTTSSIHHHDEKSRDALSKMSFTELSRLRVIQKNMVYVIGLSPQVAKADILEKFEYFGQYGKVTKVIVNKSNVYNAHGPGGPSYSAYISFSNDMEASIAILAVDEYFANDRIIRASYGTTKYCTFFLRDKQCPNPTCLYLHSMGKDRDSFLKDDNVSNKDIFNDQQKLALEHIHKHYSEILKKINLNTKSKSIFPSVKSIQEKLKAFIEENEKQKAILKSKETEAAPEKIIEAVPIKTEERPNENIDAEEYPQLGTEKSVSKIEETKQETPKKNTEDSVASNENAIESNRSSSSNQSTAVNSGKKENEIKAANEQSETNNVEEIKESELVTEIAQEQFIGDINLPSLITKIDIKENNAGNTQSEFDMKVLSHLLRNFTAQSTSRFTIVQHNGRDEYEEIAQSQAGQQDALDERNEEFNFISRSIQDFVISTASCSQTGPNIHPDHHISSSTAEEGNLYGSPSYSIENYPNFSTPTKKTNPNVNSNKKIEENNIKDLSHLGNKIGQLDKDAFSRGKNNEEEIDNNLAAKSTSKGKGNKKNNDKGNNKPLNTTNNSDKNGTLRGVPNTNRDTNIKSSSDKAGGNYTKNINGFNNSSSYNLIQTTL